MSTFIRKIKSNKILFYMLFVFLISGCEGSSSESTAKTENTNNKNEDNSEEIFKIAVLPDTQYYTSEKHGGTIEMFEKQIDWILTNHESENIQYVVHLGDLVEHGEQEMNEWVRAKKIMYKLESSLPNFPHGIPYGISVGNHDQQPYGNPMKGGTQDGYNKFFGREHFEGRDYYGGAYGTEDNDNHYDKFSFKEEKFIIIFLEYNEPGNEHYNLETEEIVFNWAEKVLKEFSDHRAIIVSHSILARPQGSTSITTGGEGDNSIQGKFTKQGARIYEKFKTSPNVFMMLCGHRSGEGIRIDTFKGNTIKTFLSDYQSRENEQGVREGGSALMRTLEFNLTKNKLKVETFIPTSNRIESMELDDDSYFSMPLFE